METKDLTHLTRPEHLRNSDTDGKPKIVKLKEQDQLCIAIREEMAKKQAEKAESTSETARIAKHCKLITDNILTYHREEKVNPKIIAPACIRNAILAENHDDPMANLPHTKPTKE